MSAETAGKTETGRKAKWTETESAAVGVRYHRADYGHLTCEVREYLPPKAFVAWFVCAWQSRDPDGAPGGDAGFSIHSDTLTGVSVDDAKAQAIAAIPNVHRLMEKAGLWRAANEAAPLAALSSALEPATDSDASPNAASA